MTDVRAITPNCSGLIRPKCEIVSSVRPSARYSLLGSPVRFSNGSTASMILWDGGGVLREKCRHDVEVTAAKITVNAARAAAFHQCFPAFEPASSAGLAGTACGPPPELVA